jgi:hypothetical protein
MTRGFIIPPEKFFDHYCHKLSYRYIMSNTLRVTYHLSVTMQYAHSISKNKQRVHGFLILRTVSAYRLHILVYYIYLNENAMRQKRRK